MDKLELLKKENELLKKILYSIYQHELYELELDYDYDENSILETVYFDISNVIRETLKEESNEDVKKRILTYFDLERNDLR